MSVHSSPLTITAGELASALSMSRERFVRRRHQLIAAGMPAPIPGAGLVWSRPQIMAWLAPRDGITMTGSDPVVAIREALEARIGECAA